MRRIAVSFLLFAAVGTAHAAPNPADYPLTLHVTSALVLYACSPAPAPCQQLEVTDGTEKYTLLGGSLDTFHVVGPSHPGFLALGDYKAKLTKQDRKPDYLMFLDYEILLPDGKTATFKVIGQHE